MRRNDVVPGGTYVVEVPHELPPQRYPVDGNSLESVSGWLRLRMLRGTRFELTIVDADTNAAPPTVQGFRTLTSFNAQLRLTLDQVLELGLPIGGAYEIVGVIRAADGTAVQLPHVETLTVPIRWLRPLDADLPPTHRDVTGHYW